MQNHAGQQGQRVGEVIAADSRQLTAQCYDLYSAPPLGSLLRVGDPPVFAVVQSIRTEPLDPGRPVLARGQAVGSLEEIYRDNPQLERLLTTRFDALVVGHTVGHTMEGEILQLLPPTPTPIHSFVQGCPAGLVKSFTDNLDFLRFLVNSGPPMADEVVVASLREAAACRADREDFVKRAGRTLTSELGGDSQRLSAILRRVSL